MPTVPSPVAKNTPYHAPYNLCNEFEYVPPVEVTAASTCIRYSYSRGQSPLSTLHSPVFSSSFRLFLLRLLACQLGIIYDFNHFLIAFNVQRFSGRAGSTHPRRRSRRSRWRYLVSRPKLMSLVSPGCAPAIDASTRSLIVDELICTHL